MFHEGNDHQSPDNQETPESEPQREVREEFALEIGVAQGMGERLNQEDAYKHEHDPQHHRTIFAIADGMGGLNFGEVASSMAVNLFCQYANDYEKISETTLNEIIEKIQKSFTTAAGKKAGLWGMGTTLTAAIIEDATMWTVHIGDSRLYHKRDAEWKQITRDHTLAEFKKSIGEPIDQRDEHTLMRSLNPTKLATPDITCEILTAGDRVVLATDGIFKHMDPDSFQATSIATLEQKTGQAAADEMLKTAMTQKMEDNGTVAVISIKEKDKAKT